MIRFCSAEVGKLIDLKGFDLVLAFTTANFEHYTNNNIEHHYVFEFNNYDSAQEKIEAAKELMDKARDKRVLVQCQFGRSRSSDLAYALGRGLDDKNVTWLYEEDDGQIEEGSLEHSQPNQSAGYLIDIFEIARDQAKDHETPAL